MFPGFMRKRCRVPLRRSSWCSSSALCSSRRTLFHGVSEEAGEVVLIEDDTLVRVGPQRPRDRAQVGARHVHGHRVDAGPFLGREPVEEAAERVCRASVRDEETVARSGSQTTVTYSCRFWERGLVDTHHFGDRPLPAGESPVHRALHNAATWSQLMSSSSATALMLACCSHSMTRHSNRAVNRDRGPPRAPSPAECHALDS